MARRRIGVEKARDIIRYRMTTTLSARQIARALGISRTVVATTIRTFKVSGLEYDAIENMPDSQLMQALAGEEIPKTSGRYQDLSQRFPAMVVELKKKGVTLQWLWELYIKEYPGGYRYSQYCLNFHRWRKSPDVVMHIEHKAGEEMFVDWAGDKLGVINGNTGEPWALEQFVAILGVACQDWLPNLAKFSFANPASYNARKCLIRLHPRLTHSSAPAFMPPTRGLRDTDPRSQSLSVS